MKGLFIKDLYHIAAGYKQILIYGFIISIINAVLTLVTGDATFAFIVPSTIFIGALPTMLHMDDHRTGWVCYSMTMPHSRKNEVNEKYLLSACISAAVGVFYLITSGVCGLIKGVPLSDMAAVFFILISSCLLLNMLYFPSVYRFGADKGKIAYLISMALGGFLVGVCAGVTQASSDGADLLFPLKMSAAVLAFSAAAFMVSWGLSLNLHDKYDN